MTSLLVELDEYSTSVERLPLALASALAAGSAGALALADPTPAGARLQSKQHVGVVTSGDVEVRIHPKVPEANVLGMLAASTGLMKWLAAPAGVRERGSLLRTIIAFYAKELTELLSGGLAWSYDEHADRLVVLRGRLDVPDLVRMGGLAAPVPCRFDEYTADHLLHRYLVTALERCLRVRELDPQLRRLLRHARHELADVPSVLLQADAIERHHFTRLDDRYRPAAALARLILEHTSVELPRGKHEVRAFTVDMNRLFEAWFARRLPDHLSSPFVLAAQTRRYLDRDARLGLRPDLEIRLGNRVVYVADTKYKLTDTGLGRITDYYQAHAYATVLGLPEALLIYCQDGTGAEPRSSEIRGSGIRVRTHAMTLQGDQQRLESQVAAVAEVIMREVLVAT
jgi:5-methylcytosine-specific restriction enzyme subunit McrC